MKTLITLSVSSICLAASLHATPKEFTILGGEKITCEVDGKEPALAQKDGIKLQQPAFVAREGEFAYQFAFDTKARVTKIVIEDVTEKSARVLLEATDPKIKKGGWFDITKPVELSKKSLPWIFEPADTTRVYKFSIFVSKSSTPVILYQPVVWDIKAKQYLRKLAK